MNNSRVNYLVEATTTFDRDDQDQMHTGFQKDYCHTLDQAKETARQWVNCEYHSNVRCFKMGIGEEITQYLDLDLDQQEEQTNE
jgi:hypothetical protein